MSRFPCAFERQRLPEKDIIQSAGRIDAEFDVVFFWP